MCCFVDSKIHWNILYQHLAGFFKCLRLFKKETSGVRGLLIYMGYFVPD